MMNNPYDYRYLEEIAQDMNPIILSEEAQPYVCQNTSLEYDCPLDCVGLDQCTACHCAVQDEGEGPWGRAMDVIFCLVPILFLVLATVPPCGVFQALPTTRSLPLSAMILFLIRLMYFGSDALLVCGSVIKGIHEALTPLSIMAGAICLFETMEVTRCLPWMMREMKALTGGHGVAEVLMIFSFAYMVEGASGFGTPVALGAPMLISLGHAKEDSVVLLLLANTFATVFGAAGTPIWFGFGSLGVSEKDFLQISFDAAVALTVAAFLLMPFIVGLLIPFPMVRDNIVFVFLSLSGCLFPMLGLSVVSYEFPSLVGGMVGCGISALLIRYQVGLKPMGLRTCEETGRQVCAATGRHPLDIGTISDRSVVALSSVYMTTTTTTTTTTSNPNKVATLASQLEAGEGPTENNNNKNNNEEEVAEESPPSVSDSKMDTTDLQVEEAKVDDDDDNNTKDDEIDNTSPTNSNDNDELPDSHRAIDKALGPRRLTGFAYVKEFLLRTSPITLTVLLLIVTRIPQIGLNALLKSTEPNITIYFGTYATFRLSASLVWQLENILSYPGLNWKYELLYTPFLIPFVLVSVVTYGVYRKEASSSSSSSHGGGGGLGGIFGTVYNRIQTPAVALAGALTLVQLYITGQDAAPASILGLVLSDTLKGGWIAIAGLMGALGSFFSGSTTVSNLTFGSVQQIAAQQIGVTETAMLALQVVGASAGNGICLNNIISACTVTGLVTVGEGQIIARTAKFVVAFVVIATLVMLPFLFAV